MTAQNLIPNRFWKSKPLSVTGDDIVPVFSDYGAGCAFNKVPTEMDERLHCDRMSIGYLVSFAH
jgi:hypothetical protein